MLSFLQQKIKNMKKLLLIWGAVTISVGSFAQTDSMKYRIKDGIQVPQNDTLNSNRVKNDINQNIVDSVNLDKMCVTMKDGKLMVLKDGMMVPMEDAMVMENGTIVLLNGMIKTKEGNVTQMNEGDCLNMYGEMIPLQRTKLQNESPPKR